MARARWPLPALIPILLGLPLSPALAVLGASETDDSACFACHNNPKWQMEFTLPSGERWPLYFDKRKLEESVHSALHCADCHPEIEGFPHERLPQDWDRREITLNLSTTCERCHPQAHQAAAESIHYVALTGGNKAAPVCTDCHGAHDVRPVARARADLVRRCGSCHRDVYDAYARSIHGVAALQRGSLDAATCADCHDGHRIEDPRTTRFRAHSPQLCARCHADKAMMSKYGLSTEVYRTYLADFHGATVALFRERPGARLDEAVCYDCHGAHDIMAVNAANSPVNDRNLLKTCQRCHPGATANFSRAWMGHYRPDLKRSPGVYYARLFYMILIPGVIAFFILTISWDMVRSLMQRVRPVRLERIGVKEEEH